MEKKFAVGVDFGTLTGRTVLIETDTGREIAAADFSYPHGMMQDYLPDDETKLNSGWALQDPQDYLDVLSHTIPEVLRKSGVGKEQIVGLGIAFASNTILPVKQDGTPLCFLPEYKKEPHTYVKSWKHLAAREYAERIKQLHIDKDESNFGMMCAVSPEWMLPKAWQMAEEAPEIYRETDYFLEAADWIVWQLTGQLTRNHCMAVKALWKNETGYPKGASLKLLHPLLEDFAERKLFGKVLETGTCAGGLSEKWSRLTGLCAETSVAVGNVDAYVAIPAVGICETGVMLMTMGTATWDVLLSEKRCEIPGICSLPKDSVMPGYYALEAGQSCVGDHFSWFVKNCVPESYYREAAAFDMNIHQLLRSKAEKQLPGESGLLALDWWNGNRSVLGDLDLTGMMVGLNLFTRPEEIYRAMIEGTAYGTRMIIETLREHGVEIKSLYAAGGIAAKDAFMMQIYADVTNMEIKISAAAETSAFGAAMSGAVAAGCYMDMTACARAVGKVKAHIYRPNPQNAKRYDLLFEEYKKLHHYFGQGENDVMKRLLERKNEAVKLSMAETRN